MLRSILKHFFRISAIPRCTLFFWLRTSRLNCNNDQFLSLAVACWVVDTEMSAVGLVSVACGHQAHIGQVYRLSKARHLPIQVTTRAFIQPCIGDEVTDCCHTCSRYAIFPSCWPLGVTHPLQWDYEEGWSELLQLHIPPACGFLSVDMQLQQFSFFLKQYN